jgi:hypothetical protein
VPGYDCLGEMLTVSSNGAIAVWSPSGLSLNDSAQTLCEGFYTAVFQDGEGVLGDAMLKALRNYEGSHRTPYMLNIYNLLGDPGLMISGLSGTYDGKSVILGHNATPLGWSYGAWKRIQFTSDELTNPMISGEDANPAGDGVPNFIKYAFGGNPRIADWHSELGIERLQGDEDYGVILKFKRRKSASDVDYILDISQDLLLGWTDSAGYAFITDVADDGNGETETVRVKARSPEPGRSAGYMRLRVKKK